MILLLSFLLLDIQPYYIIGLSFKLLPESPVAHAGTCYLFLVSSISFKCLEVRENSWVSLVPSLPLSAQHVVNATNAGGMNEFSLTTDDLGDPT